MQQSKNQTRIISFMHTFCSNNFSGSGKSRATSHHQHYEAITGGPSFMYALLRLCRKIEH